MTHNPTATRDPQAHTPGPLCGTQFVRLHPHMCPGKRVHSIHTSDATLAHNHTYPQSTAACDPRNIPPLILTALLSRS